MKKGLIVLGIVAVAALFYWLWTSEKPNSLGVQTNFVAPTIATSSIGTTLWTTVLTADSSRQYAIFCNDSKVANSAIYLGLGATSTPHANGIKGIPVPSATCFEMTLDKMFNGTVYAVASSSTSTLITTSK